MISIRKKLLISILSMFFSITVLLAMITYITVRKEMDEFYDENLKQVAHTILATGLLARDKRVDAIEQSPRPHGEEEYLTQIWHNNILEYSSHPLVAFPLQHTKGTGQADFQDSQWRFYTQTKGDITVQLAQDLRERHSIVIEIYGVLLIPIAIQFPVLALLIWWLVDYGLKPLRQISALIQNRNPSFLEPIANDRAPNEIHILLDALNGLLSRLKNALMLQKQFTADAAHELRTPLTAVRLQLDILKRAENEAEAKAALDMLEQAIFRSSRLAEQLLELARQEPEHNETTFAPTDLTIIAHDITEQARPIAQTKNISVTTNCTKPSIISGNAAQLSIMMRNLVHNAIIYTPKGGAIDVTIHQENNQIILDVIDNGIGIAAQEHTRIFDRFYRVAGTYNANSGTGSGTGSGLGLSIVKNIVTLHQGDIRVLPGPHSIGTIFRVIFPQSDPSLSMS